VLVGWHLGIGGASDNGATPDTEMSPSL